MDIRLSFLVVALLIALNPGIAVSGRESNSAQGNSPDLDAMYAEFVEYENHPFPEEQHIRLLKLEIILQDSEKFWAAYKLYSERHGRRAARELLLGFVAMRGCSTVLITPSSVKQIDEEMLRELFAKSKKNTLFLNFIVGKPINWDKVMRFRKEGTLM